MKQKLLTTCPCCREVICLEVEIPQWVVVAKKVDGEDGRKTIIPSEAKE